MLWLIVPIIAVVIALLLGYRKTAVGVLIAAVIAAGLIYWHTKSLEQKSETRIPAAEAPLTNVTVRHTFDASYEISGTIRNSSETYRIDGISVTVRLRDCLKTDASKCTPIGHATANVPVTVPPQQTRNFTGALYYGKDHKPAKGRLACDYEIIAIRAKRQ